MTMKRKAFEKALEPMTVELNQMARWVAETGQRVVVLFEGRDAAGKGGAIEAVGGGLNPRQCRTIALPAPTDREKGQWYFQRYVPHLPAKGEIALFDRSWYNRAGVEKIMGWASAEEVDAFLAAVPAFEKMLVDDGMLLFKYWLTVDQKKQEERLAERRDDPTKRWKLSGVDVKGRALYDEYTEAREAMLRASHTSHAPWTLVDFNDQKRGRLTLVRDLLDRLPDTALPFPELDWPELEGKPAKEKFGLIKPIPSFDD